MTRHALTLPQFVRDLLASPPRRGEGLNLWYYRTARVLHPYRDPAEIIELLKAATAGEPVKHGEIERAVERSKATAWKPSQSAQRVTQASEWPKVNAEQREAVIASGVGLVDLWEISPVRFEDDIRRRKKSSTRSFQAILCCAWGEAPTTLTHDLAKNGAAN